MTAADTRTDGYDRKFWAAIVGVAMIPMELTLALWSDPWVRSNGWVMFASAPLTVAAMAALDYLHLFPYQWDRERCGAAMNTGSSRGPLRAGSTRGRSAW